MNGEWNHLKTKFVFGPTTVHILQGDILAPGVEVDAVVNSDDNYLTMAGGVAKALRLKAGASFVRAAQEKSPLPAGAVIVTKPFLLKQTYPGLKAVLHGAVIDYDAGDLSLEEIVRLTTTNCLQTAVQSKLKNLLFPAFGSGAGGLSMERCAYQMCHAIKAFLGQDRPIENLYIILYRPNQDAIWDERNHPFIREANLVLDVPYDPRLNIRHTRDIYAREEEIERLSRVIQGEMDDEGGKRHAVILGGPRVGKEVLLDKLYSMSKEPGSPLRQGRMLVRISFGRVHGNTPVSFVYQKFLCALMDEVEDATLTKEIRAAYSDPDMNCERFLKFLTDHGFTEVVFLIDRLPRLLEMESDNTDEPENVVAFWRDLDRLQRQVRFIYSARDEQYQELEEERLRPFSEGFRQRVTPIRAACISPSEREMWVDAMFQRYLGCQEPAPASVHDLMAEEAGHHPYLISLISSALIERIKRDLIDNPEQDPDAYETAALATFIQEASKVFEQPRADFFAMLIDTLDREHRHNLQELARAVVLEDSKRALLSAVEADPDAPAMLHELYDQGDPRDNLHLDRLRWLASQGYLVHAKSTRDAAFMSRSFALYTARTLRLFERGKDQPQEVVISLLSQADHEIRTLFRGRGARIITARKRIRPELKDEFIANFSGYLRARLHPTQARGLEPDSLQFRDMEEISNYILTQFTDVTIKRHLDNPPQGSTILFLVDEALKEIPWELMLEAVYAGEIPFRVGRNVVSFQEVHAVRPPSRGISRVKTLLIGDPTDDLKSARDEVTGLADRLRRDARFEEPDVFVGSSQCRRIRLLNALSSGKYGLVHYSGHTHFDYGQSAWHLSEGYITTEMLTNAVQMAPPPLIVSSSCESGVSARDEPILYEDQSFDLPNAFLQAGVEAYIGTLWAVDSEEARRFSERFYTAFLAGEHNLGECLRQAKWDLKQREEREHHINWLAYILYGDPRLIPADLFPGFRKPE